MSNSTGGRVGSERTARDLEGFQPDASDASDALIHNDSNPVAAAYDSVADFYDQCYGQRKSRAENRVIIDLLKSFLGRYDYVLDLGCGTGFPLDHLNIDERRYLGLDISPRMVERASAKYPRHRFVVGDMSNLSPVQTGSFDAVLSLFGSFSYVMEPSRAVTEIRRVLKPGGRVLMMLLGPRYSGRATYILNRTGADVPRRLYSCADAGATFSWLSDLRVSGLSCAVDLLPEFLPQKLFNLYLKAETRTLGRVFADRNYFLLVSGRAS